MNRSRSTTDSVHVQPEPLPPMGTGPKARGSRGHEFADRSRARMAEAFDNIGERIEDRGRMLRRRGGTRARAGRAAIAAGHAFEAGAEYLREHEWEEMREALETHVRARPFPSIAMAAAAGFLLARILRR